MAALSAFRTAYAPRDEEIAARLLLTATLPPEAEKRVDQTAKGMIHAIRTKTSGLGGVEAAPDGCADFLAVAAVNVKVERRTRLAVAQRQSALLNSNACSALRKPINETDYLASRPIAT